MLLTQDMHESMQDSPELGVSERIGNITMRVRAAPRTAESQARWDRRHEAMAAWLLAQWEREQLRRIAENN